MAQVNEETSSGYYRYIITSQQSYLLINSGLKLYGSQTCLSETRNVYISEDTI